MDELRVHTTLCYHADIHKLIHSVQTLRFTDSAYMSEDNEYPQSFHK